MSNGDLLTPSLTDASRMPIFSVNAMIAAAFFGGAFAVPLLAMENSRRLARLHRDAPVLVLGLLIAAAALLFTVQSVGALGASESRSEFRLISRGIGFAFVGACYWLHRRAHRAVKTVGIEPASPWLAVIITVFLSAAISATLHRYAA
jgi:hypothetical protein